MAPTSIGVPDNLPIMLKRARKAAGFTNAKDFLAAVTASGRKSPSYSTYAQWESGEVTPRDNTLDPVIDYHREQSTWPNEPSVPDLAAAISDLVIELRAARQERESYEARLRAVEAELESLRGPRASEGSGGLSAPRETTGSK